MARGRGRRPCRLRRPSASHAGRWGARWRSSRPMYTRHEWTARTAIRATEVMGDGQTHQRQSDAVQVGCVDCHIPRSGESQGPDTVTWASLDQESRKLLDLRNQRDPSTRFLTMSKGHRPFVNTSVEGENVWLTTKVTNLRLEMKAPAAVCLEAAGHARLTCVSCHGAWAPRCPTCHTRFDANVDATDLVDGHVVRGAWVESSGTFQVVPPTLGIRRTTDGRGGSRDAVDTFIPGNDRDDRSGRRTRTSVGGNSRWWSASVAIVRAVVRAALLPYGWQDGRGRASPATTIPLHSASARGNYDSYAKGPAGTGRSCPNTARRRTGFPADAWTGFLQDRSVRTSTSEGSRPFTADEQRRILAVGACLTCHDATSRVMKESVSNFQRVIRRASPKCVIPR